MLAPVKTPGDFRARRPKTPHMPEHPEFRLPAQPPDVPCPRCGRDMRFTGLPDFSGPVYERIWKCPDHGYLPLSVDGEPLDGWG